MSINVAIILASAVLTYLTRAGGHLVLSRFERVHPRVETALNAVPAAVLTTLVAPALWHAGPAEIAAMVAAAAVMLAGRGMLAMFLTGAIVLALLRQFMG